MKLEEEVAVSELSSQNAWRTGSEWSIWDLHVHSPVWNKNPVYDQFINNLSAAEASVIGICDYCTVQGYKDILDRGGVPGKVLFPVVELRMDNVITNRKGSTMMGGSTRINFHLIFDNNPTLFPKIEIFVRSLLFSNAEGFKDPLGTITAEEIGKVGFNFDEVLAKLHEAHLREHCLIWTPYDEYGGIDDINPNNHFFKLHIIKESDIIGSGRQKQIDFFKWRDPKFTEAQYRQFTGVPKPCIKGSDSHAVNYPFGRLRDENTEPIERYCWIKANPTFTGLQQILFEPDRVYIGREPELLQRQRSHPHKFIREVFVDKEQGVRSPETWFNALSLPFNPGLVAIIGKKGNGKSAIADILGLCANAKNSADDLSFLHKYKFRNPKSNRAKEYAATLTWRDGSDSGRVNLDAGVNQLNEERLKYIPQNYLEKLCVNEDQKEFESELKQIIFMHIPQEDRLGEKSLDDLLVLKQKAIESGIRKLQLELAAVNKGIVRLESKAKSSYKSSVAQQIADKEAELRHHDENKPKEKPKPDEDAAQRELNEGIVAALAEKGKLRTLLEQQVQALQLELTQNNISINELDGVRKEFSQLDKSLKGTIAAKRPVLEKYGINLDDVLSYSINLLKISERIAQYYTRNEEIDGTTNGRDSAAGLQQQIAQVGAEVSALQGKLAQSQKEYHEYLQSVEAWEKRRLEIVGAKDAIGTLEFFRWELAYLNTALEGELKAQYAERMRIAGEIFKSKQELLSIYGTLYRPITEVLQKEATFMEEYKINVNASLMVRGFPDRFLAFINQRAKGTYAGTLEGRDAIEQLIAMHEISALEGTTSFLEGVLDSLKHDKRVGYDGEVRHPDEQLKGEQKLEDLYDYIFSLGFIEPQFKLQLGTKDLKELSPGERGAILLIFYLFLDLDNKPLIIDQPEENLDNESIYYYLVHFIKKAKTKRQIILITHNPNLAVVCDADQIIHMAIDKQNKNEVSFVSGAIENPEIVTRVINILEGTKPAFDNRRLKYASIVL